jgi:hypothetical protein
MCWQAAELCCGSRQPIFEGGIIFPPWPFVTIFVPSSGFFFIRGSKILHLTLQKSQPKIRLIASKELQ